LKVFQACLSLSIKAMSVFLLYLELEMGIKKKDRRSNLRSLAKAGLEFCYLIFPTVI